MRYRYSKYTPNPLDELDLEDVLDRLRDFLLDSGFESQFYPDAPPANSMQALYRALANILSSDERLPEEWRQAMDEFEEEYPNGELPQDVQDFFDELIQKLIEENYLQVEEDRQSSAGQGEEGEADQSGKRFKLTEKSIDYLGHRTLRELLSSLGQGAFGKHRTRRLSTGIEADWHSRPYEFGDTLNLDVNATLLKAIRREGLGTPLNLEYSDLMVHQSEYHSSCATVIMLDCSHSMILYGEDRFTPAKKVTLALAHMIRTQFPEDTLKVILFHDSAEEVPVHKVAEQKIGPWHTNTCEGFRLARRILMNQKKDLRQIIMVTDGKPSALTLEDGRIYKNSFGLDPYILNETFKEAANCRRSGIMINTFMLARDYYLVEFVKQVAQISRGKAYLTNTFNLADHVLIDFMTRKSKTVH
ncbi:MAG TPA: VWA domain-containing protein [Acidobacteriota bacterium]|nr:VWA domain-containing protein [Acidobacteriota bacterium]